MNRAAGFALLVLLGIGSATTASAQWGLPGESDYEIEPGPGAGGSAVVLEGVPSYTWWHGCGPTALGMLIGFWDGQGFERLIPGSNDWDTNRQAIREVIASPGHVADYVPTPDAPPPHHADDCLADFCRASRDPQEYGWSNFGKQDDALRLYAEFRGYDRYEVSQARYYSGGVWDGFMAEIDAGRPVEFLVDTNGDGKTDHFVTAVGYEALPGERRYGCYDTRPSTGHDVRWCDFQLLGQGNRWGVYGATFFQLIPEPPTLALAAMGAVVLLACLRTRRRRAQGSAEPIPAADTSSSSVAPARPRSMCGHRPFSEASGR